MSDSFLGGGVSSSKDRIEPCFSFHIFVVSPGKLWDKEATDGFWMTKENHKIEDLTMGKLSQNKQMIACLLLPVNSSPSQMKIIESN